MKEDAKIIRVALQQLQIKATEDNVLILAGVYNTLRKMMEEGDEHENGSQADSE